ncbi:hypothetical protein JR316_0009505 [Psilocybe cubensis]|nr:hypothetical protein JR316_0009505 [Psilocybe cubensis]KAH9477301.1 hypothetical protein JR316_0009505 [Psilocybe cubensis]
MYYLSFPNDPLRNKVLVYTIFAFEVLQTIIVTISAYHVFATGYGNFAVYNAVDLAWLDVPVISGIVAFIAEGFYAYRISLLSQSYYVAGVIVVLATVQLAGSIAAAVVLKNADMFSRLLGVDYSITAAIWNGGSALCDAIIAICMTYYLSKRGSESMKTTNVIVRRVIRLVIETGTVTAAIAIINLILSVLPSKPAYYQIPSVLLAKVYSNSMMAVFNSRIIAYGKEHSEVNDNISGATSAMGRGVGPFRANPGISVHRQVMHEGETFELRGALAMGTHSGRGDSRDADDEYSLGTSK